jgi:hypothetical protein
VLTSFTASFGIRRLIFNYTIKRFINEQSLGMRIHLAPDLVVVRALVKAVVNPWMP